MAKKAVGAAAKVAARGGRRKGSTATASSAKATSKTTRQPSKANAPDKTDIYNGITHWLVKSEPSYSMDDLQKEKGQTCFWDGVRNFECRNTMRDRMKKGHTILFYRSVVEPAAVGVCEVVKEGYPDFTAWDPKSEHPDSSSTKENPKWFMVDFKLKGWLNEEVPLSRLREHGQSGMPLENMALFKRSRLSVQPIRQQEFEYIVNELAGGWSKKKP